MLKSVSKTGLNGVTVTVSPGSLDYRDITLTKDGVTLVAGYTLITLLNGFKDLSSDACSVLQCANNKLQPLGKDNTDTVKSAIEAYNNQDAVRLPSERANIVMEISCLYEKESYLREQDYDNDIGFHLSAPAKTEIDNAKEKLEIFDKKYPEIAKKVNEEISEKNKRAIKSALNA